MNPSIQSYGALGRIGYGDMQEETELASGWIIRSIKGTSLSRLGIHRPRTGFIINDNGAIDYGGN
jgi:hypothetical protein